LIGILLAILGALVAGGAVSALPDERILEFDSRIAVDADGGMMVTETITVSAAGLDIKRGIYREFPTTYRDRHGNSVRVRFEVLEVLRDGRPEPYHLRDQSNGKAVYIGHKDRLLPPGTYTYTLVYRTDRQIGFFDEFDELYWNVTGNGWRFPIDRAAVLIELPAGAEVLQYAAYTGRQGERGRDVEVLQTEGTAFSLASARTLRPGEGLTVAVAWPKGYVREPDAGEKMAFLFRENLSLAAAGIGLLLLAVYYTGAWFAVGKDPAGGTVIPRFEPPEGLSPAAARFLMRMGYDRKCFAAAVVNLAVRGALTIDEDDGGGYSLQRNEGDRPGGLSGGERQVLDQLFRGGASVRLENKNHARISKAMKALKNRLSLDFEKVYFLRNKRHFIPGLVLTALTLVAVVSAARNLPVALFMTVWLSMWTVGCCFLGLKVYHSLRDALRSGRGRGMRRFGAVGITLFALPFFGGEIFGLTAFAAAVSPAAVVLFLAAIVLTIAFYHLLKAPTLLGRRVMDEVEGFRLYLAFAEKERLDFLNPPEETPELFEAFLPYALALDVENQWNRKFAALLAAAAAEKGAYRPSFYTGRSWAPGDVANLGSSLGGAFAGAISSASTAPGSSSGSGGGGSSGGGGGGGGGGGW